MEYAACPKTQQQKGENREHIHRGIPDILRIDTYLDGLIVLLVMVTSRLDMLDTACWMRLTPLSQANESQLDGSYVPKDNK